jgi:hypothetical protein
MGRIFHYGFCGLTIRSALALASLPAADAPEGRPAEIEIVGGRAQTPANPTRKTEFLTVGADGSALLTVAGVARIRIDHGNLIVVEPAAMADEPAIGVFVAGAALGLLAHQRGLLPIHGAFVRVGSAGVLLTGPTGAGKSTLAMWLARRGHAVFGDDLCVLTEGPAAWAPNAAVKLWADAVGTLGVPAGDLRLLRRGSEKHVLSLDRPDATLPQRVHAVLSLVFDARARTPEIAWLSGAHALDGLIGAVFRLPAARAMGRASAIAHQALTLLSGGGLKIGTLRRPPGFDGMDAVADALERVLGS